MARRREARPSPARPADQYAAFVKHPRFGQRPRITGLDLEQDLANGIHLHWHSPRACRVPNTAIAADLSKQSRATVPVTHYFDVERVCRDCTRPFLFFAEEQRHWYETLGFPLEADCVRCVECRKREQGLERKAARYETLFHTAARSVEQTLEMADCALALVAAGVFHRRQFEHVRALLRRLPDETDAATRQARDALAARLAALAAAGSD